MKILHVASIDNRISGIKTVISKIVPLQIKLGNDVRIVSVRHNVYLNLNIATITSRHLFLEYIKEWPPDIVIFHSMYELDYISYSKIITRRRIPYLVQMHGALSVLNYQTNHLKKFIANFLFFGRFLKNAQSLIYLNNQEYLNCIAKKYNNAFSIVPNGCDAIDNITFSPTTNSIIEIVYIGRIEFAHKALDILISAIRILFIKKFAHVHFSFYGTGKENDLQLFKQIIKGLEGYADYKGEVRGENKIECLRCSDIFILTSRSEGMPMSVLEALSYGIPCILTPGTNMADEVVNNNAGWKTDCTAESISRVVENSVYDYRNESLTYKHSAHMLSKRYDWNKIAEQSIKLYRQIFNKYNQNCVSR